ncbi:MULTISPECIES: recombinase family protein [unclassified Microbacterium]|uniref:recombinase family protein n=1 Tax=unclassified Microbacterium TaxID=2609290 RepID=UPI00301B104B
MVSFDHADGSSASLDLVLRAVSYLRVSTREQAERGGEREGFSIPAQRQVNRKTAHGLGAWVVKEFVDAGASATSAARPALTEMLEWIRTNRVGIVIVHKLDRLARNCADDVQITQAIADTGAALVSSTEAIDASASGRLVHGIMASIAEFYSRNLATEVSKGLRQKAMNGRTPEQGARRVSKRADLRRAGP